MKPGAKKTVQLIIPGMYAAVLLALQFALSGVQGVELVTVFLLCFAFAFGVRSAVMTACAFSVIRCVIFGFFPNVLILYLIYYTAFAVIFGLLGEKFGENNGEKHGEKHSENSGVKKRFGTLSAVLILAVVLTVCFTLLDDIITPLYYGYSLKTAKVYFISSLPVMAVQSAFAAVSVSALFYPLSGILKKIRKTL